MGCPSFARTIPRHSFETAGIILALPTILLVLALIADSQIVFLAIQTVAIPMVNFDTPRRTQDEAM
jgi:hypothetical protein